MGRRRESWSERVRQGALTNERWSYVVLGLFIILGALESYLASLFSPNPGPKTQTEVARGALVILGELHFVVAFFWTRIRNRRTFLKITFLVGLIVVIPLMILAHAPVFSGFVIVLLAWASYVGMSRRRRTPDPEAASPPENRPLHPEHP